MSHAKQLVQQDIHMHMPYCSPSAHSINRRHVCHSCHIAVLLCMFQLCKQDVARWYVPDYPKATLQ
jgi:hypothetical protein